MKTVKWLSSKGNELKITIEYQARLETEEILEKGNMILYIDGKETDSCYNMDFWSIISTEIDGYFRIWGIEKVAFIEVVKEEIEKAIEDAIKEGTPQDVLEFKEEMERAEKQSEIEKAKKIIEKAEKQEFIPTNDEYKAWITNFNNLYNEGCEGYIPELVTREQYEKAKELILKNCHSFMI